MKVEDFRRVALSFEGAEEGSHLGSVDFRVGGRIFATLAHAGLGVGNLMLTPEKQAELTREAPELFIPVAGGWGRNGATHIRLEAAGEDVLCGALRAAYMLRKEKNSQRKRTKKFAGLLLILCCATVGHVAADSASRVPLAQYIRDTWHVLTRSNSNLAKAAPDPKFHAEADGRWPVYIPQNGDAAAIGNDLRAAMSAQDFRTIVLRKLPQDWNALHEAGLLYLPHPYVVPGGRFNEMYGWDSYFIQVGLLRDGEIQLAKDMANNFLYEVKNYGAVLNANRTYYLTRSQPPFLTQMVLNVYDKTKDKDWLAAALPQLESYYRFWTTGPHLTPETGLSRYWDFGEGPAPEVVSAEHNAQGQSHYELVRDYYRAHKISDYDVSQYYDRGKNELKPLFYKGDRSMRESGFDPSNRFGPFNIDIIHYNPVCLNSLLYLMEQGIAEVLSDLGRNADAAVWRGRAQTRAEAVKKLMWDAPAGLFYDYDFATGTRRAYPFLTTFYPLWAGFATKEQAAAVVRNLGKFERNGGLQTSDNVSGNQWDSPFGWAPIEMIAVDGLRRYGFNAEAERVSMKWLRLLRIEYTRQGFLVEKYDVVHDSSNVEGQIHFGYSANQAGFGWTNASYTHMYDELSQEDQRRLDAIH